MSEKDSNRPVRPFLASHDVSDAATNKTQSTVKQEASSSDFAAILPASALKEQPQPAQNKPTDPVAAAQPSPEKPAAPKEAVSEPSPVRTVEPQTQAASSNTEQTALLSEKIAQSTATPVAPPMPHYDRKESPQAKPSLSAAEIVSGGRRSASTKKARTSATVGMLAVVAIAVGVYMANQEVYSLFSPNDTIVSSPNSNHTNADQTTDPATLAAMAGTRQLTLSGRNFENLDEGHYQLWLEQDSKVTSLGIFGLDEAGQVVDEDGDDFKVEVTLSDKPARVFVTIESGSELKEKPSSTVLMSGAITGQDSNLVFNALDTSGIGGVYALATPTDLSDENVLSGIWFAKTDGQTLTGPGLTLPKAPAGWVYEGQMIFKNQIIAMGRFSSVSAKDNFQRFTPNPDRTPSFPGEDYLQGAPSRLGLDFPTNLASGEWKVLITLEPDNNGVDPTGDGSFYLHLLEASIAKDSKPYTEYPLKSVADDLPSMTVNLQ